MIKKAAFPALNHRRECSFFLRRRWRDLNPRAGYPTYRISSADPSATWVHLQESAYLPRTVNNYNGKVYKGQFFLRIFLFFLDEITALYYDKAIN